MKSIFPLVTIILIAGCESEKIQVENDSLPNSQILLPDAEGSDSAALDDKQVTEVKSNLKAEVPKSFQASKVKRRTGIERPKNFRSKLGSNIQSKAPEQIIEEFEVSKQSPWQVYPNLLSKTDTGRQQHKYSTTLMSGFFSFSLPLSAAYLSSYTLVDYFLYPEIEEKGDNYPYKQVDDNGFILVDATMDIESELWWFSKN